MRFMNSRAHASLGPPLIFSVVLVLALLGILTRPLDFLAAFWPANAVLLGLFIRKPQLASALGWLAAFLAYVLADLLTGGEFGITVRLTLANLAGVATAFLIVQRCGLKVSDLHKPLYVLHLFTVCAAGALASAIIGGGAAPSLLHASLLPSTGFWFTTELLNFIVLMPLVLTFPSRRRSDTEKRKQSPLPMKRLDKSNVAPILALLFSMVMSLVIGGPGALLFSVPALLWCALTYSLFVTSLLTMLVCSFTLIAISASWLAVPFSDDYFASLASVRLGVLLLALAPLTVASINAARLDLLRLLSEAANYDGLTRVLSRSAFMTQASLLIKKLNQCGKPFSVIMIDIDHFKAVNDTYGHATGDQILVEVSARLRQVLRDDDLFGRLGGEEFAVVLAGLQKNDARLLADRLCKTIEDTGFTDEATGQPLNITISLGIVSCDDMEPQELGALLSTADEALYKAKNAGRNQVIHA